MRKLILKSLEKKKITCSARKKLRRAMEKRKQRKTPFPVGFEYKKW